ncbi:MAG TPA: NUDIX hydrolase [Halobacteria archaeon]|jgi:8-oxo-dGTP diphosphatase|nr:NUDIX hydrolase [Halobacteria archaeon]
MSSFNLPKVAVDGIVLYNKNIVLIQRKNPPFKGRYALPGGFVEYGETTESALKREVKEETGLNAEIIGLVGVYSDPNRDPRGHVISICYLALGDGDLKADTDAELVSLFSIDNIPELAFDHNQMINDAKEEINEVLSKM